MREYQVGWDKDAWPTLTVGVPDNSELATADITYEHPTDDALISGKRTRALTLRLVFIDTDPEVPIDPATIRGLNVVRGET